MTAAPELSVVIPAYREAGHLADSLGVIRAAVAALGVPYELVVVDDGSPDDTWAVLQRLALRWPEIEAIRLARNFGKEGALRAGLEASRGDAVVIMDADLQHPPDVIPRMYRLWAEDGFEVVNAVKRARGDESWLRRRLARLYYGMFSRFAGVEMRGSSDFKLLDRRAVETYCRFPERNTFFRGLVSWMGFNQTSVSFDVAPRVSGETGWSYVKLARLAIGSMVGFSAFPLQAVTLLGFGFLAFAVVLGLQTLWQKMSGGAIEGFTTLILLLLFVGAILMIALGIIGQYIAAIYDEVKGRPRYLVREEVRHAVEQAPVLTADDRDRTDQSVRARARGA